MTSLSNREHEVMTLRDVAEYLRLNERTVLKMARKNEIPATKVVNQWRFMRSLVNDWLMYKMETLPPYLDADENKLKEEVKLHKLMRPDLMNLNVVPGDKMKIFGQLTFPMIESGFLTRRKYFLDRLMERENLMTTALGNGIAVPHARHPIPNLFPESAIAVGICREGTDFEADDGKPVHVFFTVCSSDDAHHLRILARIAKFASSKPHLRKLKKTKTPEEIIATMKEFARK
jgi:PTS system nitrogen regulatory IIA component